MGYRANAEQIDEDQAYEATIENFGTEFAENLSTFSQLTESNIHLGQNVAANITDLRGQIKNIIQLVYNMSMANNTHPTNMQKLPNMQQPPHIQQMYQQQPYAPTSFNQPPWMQQYQRNQFQN